jgi:hypothetical protein
MGGSDDLREFRHPSNEVEAAFGRSPSGSQAIEDCAPN